MAVKTFYPDNVAASSPGWFGVLTETSFTAGNTTAADQVGKLAINSFAKAMAYGSTGGGNTTTSTTSLIDSATGPTAGTGNGGSNVLGDSIRTPTTLNGSFASGNWVITWAVQPNVVQMQGRVRTRVWRSANADGSSATLLSASTQVGGVTAAMSSTTTVYTSAVTWAAPAITLTNEYLFFQIEWQEQTSAGTSNTGKFNNRYGADTTIVTTDFTAAAVTVPFIPYRTKHRIRR